MGTSLPIPQGSNLIGSLSFMGKTTLFSRVALSPNAIGDKKSNASKNAAPSSMDMETNASTQHASTTNQLPQQMGKTVRSSTQTSTFKDAI